ncbi:hypothetical protein EFP20_14405 [Burkholderia glumae]|nr:hypothetical protein EFP17_20500 [Burkholderia glumae]UVT02711.1 hypothetical protein EFP20_14405 [Burkholderia glumae]
MQQHAQRQRIEQAAEIVFGGERHRADGIGGLRGGAAACHDTPRRARRHLKISLVRCGQSPDPRAEAPIAAPFRRS